MISHRSDGTVVIAAKDHLEPSGSVVPSGIQLAEAVLKSLADAPIVTVDLEGVRGASSSYFNAFLRRVEEECGLGALGANIRLRFGSTIQQDLFQRSFDSMVRAARRPPGGGRAESAQS